MNRPPRSRFGSRRGPARRGARRSARQGAQSALPLTAGSAITAITASPRDPDLRLVKVGRRTVATLSESDVRTLGIAPGVEWTPALADRSAAAKQRAGARAYAVRALSRHGMSRARLLQRLARRGIEPEAAAAIADEMTRAGLLDEAAFADSVVRSELSRRPAGKMLLLARLRQRGIGGSVARKTVDEAIASPDYDALEGAITIARRRLRTIRPGADPQAAQRRLFSQLSRRGFAPDICREAVARVLGRTDED